MVGKTARVYIHDVSLTSPFPDITLSSWAKEWPHILVVAIAKQNNIESLLSVAPCSPNQCGSWRTDHVVAVLWFRVVLSQESKCHSFTFLAVCRAVVTTYYFRLCHGLWPEQACTVLGWANPEEKDVLVVWSCILHCGLLTIICRGTRFYPHHKHFLSLGSTGPMGNPCPKQLKNQHDFGKIKPKIVILKWSKPNQQWHSM